MKKVITIIILVAAAMLCPVILPAQEAETVRIEAERQSREDREEDQRQRSWANSVMETAAREAYDRALQAIREQFARLGLDTLDAGLEQLFQQEAEAAYEQARQLQQQRMEEMKVEIERQREAQERYRQAIEMQKQGLQEMETRLERMYRERVDSNPYATGETLDWGSGWNFGVQLAPNYITSLEIGYTFNLPGWKAPWEPEYIGRKGGYRLGLALGGQHFYNETPMVTPQGDKYYSSGYAPYFKFTYGSPVLLNFISTQAFLKAMMIFPLETHDDAPDQDPMFGFGAGGNVEFWIAENKCVTLGFTLEGSADDIDQEMDAWLPFVFRPQAGVKIYF